ncbi:MAG: iron uptake system protein EfeO [Steroidobacteraceae bacterium]
MRQLVRINLLATTMLATAAATLWAVVPSTALGAAAATTAPISNGASQVRITLTADNGGTCGLDYSAAKAGPITFTVLNRTATAITEIELQSSDRILGEKENLAPGLPPVSFTLNLGGGTYQVYCPGATQELHDFKVSGAAAAAAGGSTAMMLTSGAAGYQHYVQGVVEDMVTAVSRLKADIDAGNLSRARKDYPLARPFWERIESDVDAFVLPGFKPTDNAGSLDYLIDMRASNLDPAVGWHGFHAIERDLFQKDRITKRTQQLADELQRNVMRLGALVKSLKFRPEDLANGAADLLEEVQTSKITGEEEAFSHYDLVDFAGNVEGAQQAFAFLAPGLRQIDPALTRQVALQFTAVTKLLETYRDPRVPGGYRYYTPQLKSSDGARLSRAIQALQEPLAQIAEKVATAD